MPPKPCLPDLSRTSYICQSCLTSLRSVVAVSAQPLRPRQQWQPSRYYSVARRGRAPRPTSGDGVPRSAIRQSETRSAGAPLNIRYFNEDKPGHYQPLQDNDHFNHMANAMDKDISNAVEELEMQMENTIRVLELMERNGMKEKADKLRKQYGDKLQEPAEDAVPQAIEDQPPPPQLAYLDLNTKTQKERVNALNRFLRLHRENGDQLTPKFVSFFWKLYVPARQTLALSWARVPAEAWDMFWAVGSWNKGDNPNRMHHIHILAQDMQAAGKPLSETQQLLAIEAMFLEGLEKGAIETWKKAAGTLGANSQTFKEYWELGIRMCSLHGDIERAMRASNTLLEPSHKSDPRILMPLIRALAQEEATREQAWESYRRLRALLGDSMQIEDYDEVIECFLSTNSVELALQTFVDMMFSGAIDLHGKTKLPAQVANRFFFGKWLKRLIGAGDLDGAYKVVCYMADRGVLAAPIQLNGLLGAWMRSKTADNVEKADKMGWAMIRSRLLFVDLRKRQQPLEQWPIQLVAVGGTSGVRSLAKETPELSYLPPATLETFSVMADSYLKRRLTHRMEELWVAFKQAEIGTDSFMMNQMLQSYIQDGTPAKAFEFFHTMTRDRGVTPDASTFVVLFSSLNVNRLQKKDQAGHVQDVAQSRKIFNDMVKYHWEFPSAQVYEQLPRLVLTSLYQLKDYAGMIVAARTMKELFGFAPSEAFLIELGSGSATLRPNRRPGKRAMTQLIQVGRYIDSLIQQQRREGQSTADLTREERAAELNAVLETLILRKAQADAPEAEIEAVLATAAEKMGAYEVAIERNPEVIAASQKKLHAPGVAL